MLSIVANLVARTPIPAIPTPRAARTGIPSALYVLCGTLPPEGAGFTVEEGKGGTRRIPAGHLTHVAMPQRVTPQGRVAHRFVTATTGEVCEASNRGEATRHPTTVINRSIDNRRRAIIIADELPAASWSNRATIDSACFTSAGKST